MRGAGVLGGGGARWGVLRWEGGGGGGRWGGGGLLVESSPGTTLDVPHVTASREGKGQCGSSRTPLVPI